MMQSSIVLELNASLNDHSEEKLVHVEFSMKLVDLDFQLTYGREKRCNASGRIKQN